MPKGVSNQCPKIDKPAPQVAEHTVLALCSSSELWDNSYWCGSIDCGYAEKILCVLVKASTLPWPKSSH